jgi:hypothetical protein
VRSTFVVVDDFYDDPDDVRGRALALDFQRAEGANYPGVTAATPDDIEPTMTAFARLLGGIDLRCRRNEGAFRIATAADMATRHSIVHVDTPDFSAVIHLSPKSAEGTYFYRHRELGLERVSEADNLRPEVRQAIEDDTLDLDAWEVTHMIPTRYNRLVVFDGKYFHSGPHLLTGETLDEGRLTQNFFFYRA